LKRTLFGYHQQQQQQKRRINNNFNNNKEQKSNSAGECLSACLPPHACLFYFNLIFSSGLFRNEMNSKLLFFASSLSRKGIFHAHVKFE
jgi:hypothetical protein